MSSRLLSPRLLVYALALLLALGLMGYLRLRREQPTASAVPALSTRDYPEIQAEGVLRLLTAYGEGSEVKEGQLTGAIYELAQRLHARTGLRVEVVLENSWEKALEQLRSGRVDLVARALPHTAEIDTVSFRPFGETVVGPLYLVQRRSDSATHVTRQLDLAGRTITLPEASPLRLFLEHLGEEIGDSLRLQSDPLYDTEQLAMQVAAGTLAYTACTEAEARVLMHHLPELDCTLPLSYAVRTTWLLRRPARVLADSLRHWGVQPLRSAHP